MWRSEWRWLRFFRPMAPAQGSRRWLRWHRSRWPPRDRARRDRPLPRSNKVPSKIKSPGGTLWEKIGGASKLLRRCRCRIAILRKPTARQSSRGQNLIEEKKHFFKKEGRG